MTYIRHFSDWLRRSWLSILFWALALLTNVATLRHSAHGFASLESVADNPLRLLWGYVAALSIDVGTWR